MAAIDAYAGESPAKIVWNLVRGDDASIEITLLDDDGMPVDTTGWSYASKAKRGNSIYTLTATAIANVITVTAPSSITSEWGAGESNPTQLLFDVQVTKGSGVKWTPVIGRIVVTPDVS